MPQKLKEVDVVVIGVGFAGSILAKELAASGLKVVGLERGKERDSVPDFQAPAIHDELKYSVRKGMMQDVSREAMTFRNHHREVALPMRQWEAFLPGTGLGGCGVERAVCRGTLQESGAGDGISPISSAVRQHDAPVYKSRGADAESLRVLRVLRALWL